MKKNRANKLEHGKGSPRRIGRSPDLADITISKPKVKDVHYLSSIFPSEEMMRLVESIIIKEQFAEAAKK